LSLEKKSRELPRKKIRGGSREKKSGKKPARPGKFILLKTKVSRINLKIKYFVEQSKNIILKKIDPSR